MMELYEYTGIVMDKYMKIIDERWHAYTQAPSEKKARANFMYQYNHEQGYGPHRKLYLPGDVKIIKVKQKIDDGEQLSFFSAIEMEAEDDKSKKDVRSKKRY